MELSPLMKGLPPSQGLASICFISVVPVERALLPGGQTTESWARQGRNVPAILPPPPPTATMSSSEALARWPTLGRCRSVCNATLHPCSPRYLLDVGQNAVTIHKGVPRRDTLVTSQHLEGGGFARSVEAEKAKAFPFADCQGDPVHRQQGLPAVIDLVETNAQAMLVTTRAKCLRAHQGKRWLYQPHGDHSSGGSRMLRMGHALLTLVSSLMTRGLLRDDSSSGGDSKTFFLSSATSRSSGSTDTLFSSAT